MARRKVASWKKPKLCRWCKRKHTWEQLCTESVTLRDSSVYQVLSLVLPTVPVEEHDWLTRIEPEAWAIHLHIHSQAKRRGGWSELEFAGMGRAKGNPRYLFASPSKLEESLRQAMESMGEPCRVVRIIGAEHLRPDK